MIFNRLKNILTYLVIISFSIIIFLLGSWFLFKNDVIHFNLTDKLVKEYDYNSAKNSERRVLILGDSQLEKWPMKHCLYKDLADYFDFQDIGYLNAAHQGFGPIEYEDQLSKIIPDYKPNLILLFYYAGNDLTDVIYRENNKPKQRNYPVVFTEEENDSGSKQIDKTQAKIEWELFEEKGIDPIIIQYARNRLANPNKIGPEYVNPHILAIGAWKPDYHFDNCTRNKVASSYGWYLLLKRFERIMTMADSIDAAVGIVVIPSNVQVDTSHYNFYRKTNFKISDELLFSNAPQQVLYEFAKDSKIKYLDLLPYFKSADHTGELYFENDDHLSEKGHLLAFDVLKNKLLTSLLKDSSGTNNVRKHNVYIKHEKWVVRQQMEIIREDSAWMPNIREKALKNNIPVDSQLFLDARYIVSKR